MNEWNDTWIDELNNDCYIRLCECRNIKKDILYMAKLMFKYNPNKNVETCLDRVIEWVTDWNNQFELFDYVADNYNKIIEKMEV